MNNIAICVIAFDRKDSLCRLLNSLSNAYYYEPVPLIISIDRSDTDDVKQFAISYFWEHGSKRIIAHSQNLGLKKHILKIGELLAEYDALVVLEDDVTVAPNFYNYAKQCFQKYRNNDTIAGISLYNFPLNYHNHLPFIPLHSDSDVYLMQNAVSWGQVWMKKQWNDFISWYNNNSEEFSYKPHLPQSICRWGKNSWLKYHIKYCIEKKKYFVYPYVSLSTNNSEAGIHNKRNVTTFQSALFYGEKKEYRLQESVKYDAFFENEIIYSILQIKPSDLCIDFYGLKNNASNKRYFLTRQELNNKVIKSYALRYKPYELNIIYNVPGNSLFLYDTGITVQRKHKRSINFWEKIEVLEYLYSFKVKHIIGLFIKILISK